MRLGIITKKQKNKDGTVREYLYLKDSKSKKRKRKLFNPTQEEKEDYKNSKKGQRRWVTCLNPVMAELDSKKREYFQQIIEKK